MRGLYTGSAADYSRPSLHAVGTGEGAQVYGWGLYASDRRGVAEMYAEMQRKMKSRPVERRLLLNGRTAEEYEDYDRRAHSIMQDIEWAGSVEKYKAELDEAIEKFWDEVERLRRTREEREAPGSVLLFTAGDADRLRAAEISYRRASDERHWLEDNRHRLEFREVGGPASEHLYEQTWFTDRADGDGSRLMNWYETVSDVNWERILAQAGREGLGDRFAKFLGELGESLEEYLTYGGRTNGAVYGRLSNLLGQKAASEFLARAGIDGVKYPVDSYGGLANRNGEAGWNYVSFRDDNLRVDHHWADGEQRFSVRRDGRRVAGTDYTVARARELLREDVEARIADAAEELGTDIRVIGVDLHGSRVRGDARPDSDLDLVVEYEGDAREDDLFDALNSDPIDFYGIRVDVNPIRADKTGTLAEYMARSDEYDREMHAEGARHSVRRDELALRDNPDDAIAAASVAAYGLRPAARLVAFADGLKKWSERNPPPEKVWNPVLAESQGGGGATDAGDLADAPELAEATEGLERLLANAALDRTAQLTEGEVFDRLNPQAHDHEADEDEYGGAIVRMAVRDVADRLDADDSFLRRRTDEVVAEAKERLDRIESEPDGAAFADFFSSPAEELRAEASEDRVVAKARYERLRTANEDLWGDIRFSVRANPRLREEVEAALNTDRERGEVLKGGRRIDICEAPALFREVGIPGGTVYTKAHTLRKIAREHGLTAEQIASTPELIADPAAIFDDNGEGYIILTDALAPDMNGRDAPVMVYLRPDESGNYVASAYSKTESGERQFVNLANAGGLLYADKDKAARLPLRGEVKSSLSTFNAGDRAETSGDESPSESAHIVPQTGPAAQGGGTRHRVFRDENAPATSVTDLTTAFLAQRILAGRRVSEKGAPSATTSAPSRKLETANDNGNLDDECNFRENNQELHAQLDGLRLFAVFFP